MAFRAALASAAEVVLRNPVAGRDLRTRYRSFRLLALLFAYVAGLSLLERVLVRTLGSNPYVKDPGAELFGVLNAIQTVALLLLAGPLAAGAFSAEREQRTLEMLLATPLPRATIALGKCLGAFAVIAVFVLSTLPLSALAMLFGGLSLWQIFLCYLGLVVYCWLICTLAVAASALFKNTVRATVAVTVFVLCLLSGDLVLHLGAMTASPTGRWSGAQLLAQGLPIGWISLVLDLNGSPPASLWSVYLPAPLLVVPILLLLSVHLVAYSATAIGEKRRALVALRRFSGLAAVLLPVLFVGASLGDAKAYTTAQLTLRMQGMLGTPWSAWAWLSALGAAVGSLLILLAAPEGEPPPPARPDAPTLRAREARRGRFYTATFALALASWLACFAVLPARLGPRYAGELWAFGAPLFALSFISLLFAHALRLLARLTYPEDSQAQRTRAVRAWLSLVGSPLVVALIALFSIHSYYKKWAVCSSVMAFSPVGMHWVYAAAREMFVARASKLWHCPLWLVGAIFVSLLTALGYTAAIVKQRRLAPGENAPRRPSGEDRPPAGSTDHLRGGVEQSERKTEASDGR